MKLFFLFLLLIHFSRQKQPLVVLPATLHWNGTNEVFVTPLGGSRVDIELTVKTPKGRILYEEKIRKNKPPGKTERIPFSLTGSPVYGKVDIEVTVSGHGKVSAKRDIASDVQKIHLFSDKTIYKAGETVNIRALPIRHDGQLFTEEMDFVLINPDNFELLHRRAKSEDGHMAKLAFNLPEHLFYGEWRVDVCDLFMRRLLGSLQFTVYDYVLPPFEIWLDVQPGVSSLVPLSVHARYLHGAKVSGNLKISCWSAVGSSMIYSTEVRSFPSPSISSLSEVLLHAHGFPSDDVIVARLNKFGYVLRVQSVSSQNRVVVFQKESDVDRLIALTHGRLRFGKQQWTLWRDSARLTRSSPRRSHLPSSPHLSPPPPSPPQSTPYDIPHSSPPLSHSPPPSASKPYPESSPHSPSRREGPRSHSSSSSLSDGGIPLGLHPSPLIEDPSPDRPRNHMPFRRAFELHQIYEEATSSLVEWHPGSMFLPLPPPYHLLPNTRFFRSAPIRPPPVATPFPLSQQQRTINRYLHSMRIQDEEDELSVSSEVHSSFNRAVGCPLRPLLVDQFSHWQPSPSEELLDCSLGSWSIWRYHRMQGGEWASELNLSLCHNHTELRAELLDSGSGSRSAASAVFDPLAPRFELISRRPALSTHSKHILVLLRGESGQARVKATCLAHPKNNKTVEETVTVGEAINLPIPSEWQDCSVVHVQAWRDLSEGVSRGRNLYLPVLSSPTLSLSSISPFPYSFTVGDTVNVAVTASSGSYLVECGGRIRGSGEVRDDGRVMFPVDVTMAGECILYVFTVDANPVVDMVLFDVQSKCEYSIEPSSDKIAPGQNMGFTISSATDGLVLLSVLDGRLDTPDEKTSEFDQHWNLTRYNNEDQFLNFLDAKTIEKDIKEKCSNSGKMYYLLDESCPEPKMTSSLASDLCLRFLLKMCGTPKHEQVSLNVAGTGLFGQTTQSRKTSKPQDDAPSLVGELPPIRKRFSPVWIFEDVAVKGAEKKEVVVRANDGIGRWSVKGTGWSSPSNAFCPIPRNSVFVTKQFFMQVLIPSGVHSNESVSATIVVSGDDISQPEKMLICVKTPRSVCGDDGAGGERGQATFSRITLSPANPIFTKTYAIRFLTVGTHNVSFTLRREDPFPGRDHCSTGEVLDRLQLSIDVAKRAETEEIYRGIILTADKPALLVGPTKDTAEIVEYRLPENPSALHTDVNTNLLDTDIVYSFTIEVAKFLPQRPFDADGQSFQASRRRLKRGLSDEDSPFLSDVITQLSIQLYKLKFARTSPSTTYSMLTALDNSISTLLSDLLRFSNCSSSPLQCSFFETKNFTSSSPSLLLSALSSSLICLVGSDPRLACASQRFVLSKIPHLDDVDDGAAEEILDGLDEKNPEEERKKRRNERNWLLKALFLRMAQDCAVFECRETSIHHLYKDFYNLDDHTELDPRAVGAISAFATNGPKAIMRNRLVQSLTADVPPYWSAGKLKLSRRKLGKEFDLISTQRVMSGDVLMNSLALMAFVSHEQELPRNMDSLADWIDAQKHDGEAYDNALDTYIASRALYEYRAKAPEGKTDMTVSIKCEGCDPMSVNVSDASALFYIPSSVRMVTFVSSGMGKAKAGFRILTSKRTRSRRGFRNDILFPVQVTLTQKKITPSAISHVVCIKTTSPLIKYLEISHGLFTGYSTSTKSFVPINNQSTSPAVFSSMYVSTFAFHVLVTNLTQDGTSCYELGLTEPATSHEPGQLAPVAITARHPTSGTVGERIVPHPDTRRSRRSLTVSSSRGNNVVLLDYVKNGTRPKRDSGWNPIDLVCFTGGACACAESSCNVQCGKCKVPSKQVRNEICGSGRFGATVELASVSTQTTELDTFQVLDLVIHHWFSKGIAKPTRLQAWVRPCNARCVNNFRLNASYILLGETEGLTVDEQARMQYVLRDSDALHLLSGDQSCSSLLSTIVASSC